MKKIMVVLGAVMRFDKERDKWIFPEIMEPEEYIGRLVLGSWRAHAAALLADQYDLLLVTGGHNTHPITKEKCSRAEELAKLIICYFQTPAEKVLPIGKLQSSHTQGNMSDLMSALTSHYGEVEELAILCPRFQMARAMFSFYKEFKLHLFPKHPVIKWIEVERVLQEKVPDFHQQVRQVYTSPEAEICFQNEEEGLQALYENRYRPKQ